MCVHEQKCFYKLVNVLVRGLIERILKLVRQLLVARIFYCRFVFTLST